MGYSGELPMVSNIYLEDKAWLAIFLRVGIFLEYIRGFSLLFYSHYYNPDKILQIDLDVSKEFGIEAVVFFITSNKNFLDGH